MPNLTRRDFLKTAAIAALGIATSGCDHFLQKTGLSQTREIPGRIVGANFEAAHILREKRGLTATHQKKTSVLIVGGGMAGLCAAWRLMKSGVDDFLICDLETKVGGNALSGANAVSAYPWGAHYVPIPNAESTWVQELFSELGIITGTNVSGQNIFDDAFVCHDPDERLYIRGTWQEGLVPRYGIAEDELKQTQRFFEKMTEMLTARGRDGRLAFAIPVALSSQDPKFRALDQITMANFMREEKFTAPSLLWYVNYGCRDDYGTPMQQTSAWAGIHYFAGRRGVGANVDADSVLTWPEGNGWIVEKLSSKMTGRILCHSLVAQIDQDTRGVAADFLDLQTSAITRVTARHLIYAAPRFTFPFVYRGQDTRAPAAAFSYAPWMVANLSLSRLPQGHGMAPCWDNVIYDSHSLGYVLATHQSLAPRTGKTVATYYHPLTQAEPASARREALSRSFAYWRDLIVRDLARVHPGIMSTIENIDVWLWGHGMIRPVPGLIWGKERAAATAGIGRIEFAHSDMSGISIFEEAQYQGYRAAERILNQYHRSSS